MKKSAHEQLMQIFQGYTKKLLAKPLDFAEKIGFPVLSGTYIRNSRKEHDNGMEFFPYGIKRSRPHVTQKCTCI